MTDTTYDQIPYPSFSFPESHPSHLAMLASLFGLQSPAVEKSSILELGCAAGGNLIPIAWQLKNARCVGVDLSSRQIETANSIATKLQLKNIKLSCLNLADIGRDFGTFDYIICHGVFSWVPPEIQTRILDICAANLAPKGVAYVSYNTLPGWNMFRTIRDMMLFHTRQFNDPAMIVGQARAFLDFASKASAQQNSAYSLLLKGELERLKVQSDAYLFHDHLEVENNPLYFHDFMQLADSKGLRYLGEASFHSMTPAEFDMQVQETLRSITDKIVAMEQYLDFLRNRTFRATLLCHRAIDLTRRIEPAMMKKYHIACALGPVTDNPSILSQTQETFRHPNGSELRTTDPLVKTLITVLRESWPAWVPYERVFKSVREKLAKGASIKAPPLAEENLEKMILQLFQQGLIELHLVPPGFSMKLAQRPNISGLARAQIEMGLDITNFRHERVALPDVFRHIATFCDGSRDKAQLISSLEEALLTGKLKMREGKELPPSGTERVKYLGGIIDSALNSFAHSALFH